MTTSTDGQICFGVELGSEEDNEFPWSGDEHFGEFDEWWLERVSGFTPTKAYPFDERGNYLPGMHCGSPEVEAYFAERREFMKTNPTPFTLVNYCSGDYPALILAVPSTCLTASRGHPLAFDPQALSVTDEQVRQLLAFCETHGLAFEGEPCWWLSSYWG